METHLDMKQLVEAQRHFFLTGATREIRFRREALRTLRRGLKAFEPRLKAALLADLGKCAAESYMSEIGMTLSGLRDALAHLRRWSCPRRVSVPLAQFPSTARIIPEPYGVALVMSPWNYPVLLSLDPLVAALAAGNCCVLKPSEHAPRVAEVLEEMLSSAFPRDVVAVVQGDVETCRALLSQPFDYIFFTGSPAVGREVMQAAARHLTPVTLELGGKSPCIVDETANMRLAARRIAFGKVLNAGQTCVAPDYVLVHRSRREEFAAAFRTAVQEMLGEDPLKNPTYTRIVNHRHYERLMGLMEGARASVGGRGNEENLRVEPTLLEDITSDSPCMQQEIFGPLLPLLSYETLEEVEDFILSRPKPLACYLFTASRAVEKRLLSSLSFGGGCINDTVIHLAVPGLPFGGVGNSGMGAYHGYAGFRTFSHDKSVLKKATWLDLPFRYHPFNAFRETVLRLFLR